MEYMNCKFFGTNIFLFKVIISKMCKEPNFVSFHYLFNYLTWGIYKTELTLSNDF